MAVEAETSILVRGGQGWQISRCAAPRVGHFPYAPSREPRACPKLVMSMRRFRFRLERVLRYRETREQIALRALQEVVQQRLQLQAEIDAVLQQMRALASSATEPTEWLQRERVLEAYATRLQRLRDTLPLLLEQEAHAREVYLQTRHEREALTRLCQRAYEHYQLELQRALQNALDEAVVYAHQRRLSEDSATGTGD